MATAQEITTFWNQYKTKLFEFYPGITLARLLTDFEIVPLDQEKLLKGIPLEYITGIAYFYKSEFKVTPQTLIPRSETEILVEDAVELIKKNNYKSILDVGTGSGAIILSIALDFKKDLQLYASDISKEALLVAGENAKSYGEDVHFIESDRFQNIDKQFDLIVSNPPYIKRECDRDSVHRTVILHEPHLALFLDDNEYEAWFRSFLVDARLHLKKGGAFLMEGHENHLQSLKRVAIEIGFQDVFVKKDYSKRDRFLCAKF